MQKMIYSVAFHATLLCLLCANLTSAQDQQRKRTYPPSMKGCTEEVYKQLGDAKLKLYVFTPKTHEGNESRPAIVFFFGGGWKGGSPQQFEQHCRYLSGRGMIAITADYRVSSRHKTKATACVADGKSAIRWVRKNAARLGVDPDRIIAAGGSAGGHVAACTSIIDGFEDGRDDQAISSKPNALALFNPALVLSNVAGEELISSEKAKTLEDRMGTAPKNLSPYHNLDSNLPPTIVFHGTADETVLFRSAELFAAKAKKLGGDIVLDAYKDQGHGFFNYGRSKNEFYLATALSLDRFLVDRGLLEGPSPETVKLYD